MKKSFDYPSANPSNLLITLIIVAIIGMTAAYIGKQADNDASIISMRQDNRYFPAECSNVSRSEFAFHYNSVSNNIENFDIESYERRHPGDVVCRKNLEYGNPGEKILHLYTNDNLLDKNLFEEVK